MIDYRQRRKIKKDYHHKNLQNPFFHRKIKKGNGGFRRYLPIIIFLAAIALFWFLFFSSFWQIKVLRVEGLTRVSEEEIKMIVWDQFDRSRGLIFKQKNIFIFDSGEVAEKITTEYNLASIDVNKKWPETLEIKVSERPYSFIFQEGGETFYASSDGYIIRESAVDISEIDKYPVLENNIPGSMIDSRDKINIKTGYLEFFLSLSEKLSGLSEFNLEKFIIDQEFNMITVKFKDGPAVYFNVLNDVGSQIDYLVLVKKEKIKDNFSKTNYIDLRYGDRVFINPDFE